MNLTRVLEAYYDMQTEFHKTDQYHKNQEPPFQNLMVKMGKLCAVLVTEHDANLRMLNTPYGFSPHYLSKTDDAFTIMGAEWLKQFDTLILNSEYGYRKTILPESISQDKELKTKLIWTYSFWVMLQNQLIRQSMATKDDVVAIHFMWLLVESAHRQADQFMRLQDKKIPTLLECYILVKESTN